MKTLFFSLKIIIIGPIICHAQLRIELVKPYDSLNFADFSIPIESDKFIVKNNNANNYSFVNEPFVLSDGTPEGTIKMFDPARYNGRLFDLGRYLIVHDQDDILISDGTASDPRRISITSYPGTDMVFYNLNGRIIYRYTYLGAGRDIQPLILPNEGELWELDPISGTSSLVYDINPGDGDAVDFLMNIVPTIEVANNLLFNVADSSRSSNDLWMSDGTSTGTFMFSPGKTMAKGDNTRYLGGRAIYIVFDHTTSLFNPWVSDGTSAGTLPLLISEGIDVEANPGSIYNNAIWEQVGDVIYFTTCDRAKLWRTDGTTAGTFMVKQIKTGPTPCGAVPGHVEEMTALGNKLFFVGDDGSHGPEPWISDGTQSGTFRLVDIRPGPNGSEGKVFTVSEGKIYFTANNGTGTRIWITDGTSVGTLPLTNIGVPEGFHRFVRTTTFQGELFIIVKYMDTQHTLWKTNGTISGTTVITTYNGSDILDGRGFYHRLYSNHEPVDLYSSDVLNKVLVKTTQSDSDNQVWLWATDGTPGNFGPIDRRGSVFKEITFSSFHEANGALYFQGRDTSNILLSEWGKPGLYKVIGEDIISSGIPDLRLHRRIPLCEESIERVRVGLSYYHPGTEPISIPMGKNNFIEGIDAEQLEGVDLPTEFLPGFHYAEFELDKWEEGQKISWNLIGEDGTLHSSQLFLSEGQHRDVLYDGNNGNILPPSYITPTSAGIPYGDEPWCGEFFFRFRLRTLFDAKGNDIGINDPNHYSMEIDIPREEIVMGEQFDIDGLTPGVTYEYHMATVAGGNVGDFGVGHQFTTPFAGANQRQGLLEEKLDNQVFRSSDIQLYPNPAQNRLSIHMTEGSDLKEIGIFSATGKKVMEVKLSPHTTELGIEQLPNGMYLLRAKSKGEIINKKFLKL